MSANLVGGPALVAKKYASGSVQSVGANSTATIALASTAITPPGSVFDLSVADTIKVNLAGKYRVLAQVAFNATANRNAQASILVNGTTTIGQTTVYEQGNVVFSAPVMAIVSLAAGDAITLSGYASVAWTVSRATVHDNSLTVEYLGP